MTKEELLSLKNLAEKTTVPLWWPYDADNQCRLYTLASAIPELVDTLLRYKELDESARIQSLLDWHEEQKKSHIFG